MMDGFDERSLTGCEGRQGNASWLARSPTSAARSQAPPAFRDADPSCRSRPRHAGLRVRGAHITGPLDLSCVTLPSVLLEDCEIPSRIDVSNAHLGALSLDRSRLQHVLARGASIDGPFDFSDVAPYADEAWVDASKALIRGGIMAERAKLKTPAKRPKEQVQHWDHVYAVRLSEAQIMGGVWLVDHFVADGGVCLDETYIRGTFSMAKGSLVTASEGDVYHPGDAFHAYALRCDGMFALNFGFAARGRIFIINSKFASRVNIDGDRRGTRPGYDFKGRVMNTNASLMLEHCEIGTSVGLYDATIDCGVSLAHSTIGNFRIARSDRRSPTRARTAWGRRCPSSRRVRWARTSCSARASRLRGW